MIKKIAPDMFTQIIFCQFVNKISLFSNRFEFWMWTSRFEQAAKIVFTLNPNFLFHIFHRPISLNLAADSSCVLLILEPH